MSGSSPVSYHPKLTDLVELQPVGRGTPANVEQTTSLGEVLALGFSSVSGYFVDRYGAVGDRKTYSGALTVTADTNPVLAILGADLTDVQVGQTVVLPLGGAAGGGVIATVGSVNPAAQQIGLIGTVATTLANIAYQATGSPAIAAAGNGVRPLEVYTLVDGIFVVPAKVTVQTTKVVSVAINTAGSGGTDGTYTFIGTSPGATPFQFTGTITGGVLASVVATPTVAGIYQASPPDWMAEPVTTTTPSGLVDATVTIDMGANSARIQNQNSSIANVTTGGGYSVKAADPISSTGNGTGVQFNMVSPGSSWQPPSVVIGTDNTAAINAAMDAARAAGTAAGGSNGRIALDTRLQFAPDGDYLVTGPLNFTNIVRLLVEGYRANIYSVASGAPIFDTLNGQNVRFQNLRVSGDATFPPRWPWQIGVISTTDTAAEISFDGIIVAGVFTDAGFLYNFGSEVCYYGLINGNFIAPYGMIIDACNSSVWNARSTFVTQHLAADQARTLQGGSAGEIALTNNHVNGSGVWILGGTQHAFGRNSYFFAHQFGVVIVGSTLIAAAGYQFECHMEGVRENFHFARGTVSPNPTPSFNRLRFADAAIDATEALFGQDATVTVAYLQNCAVRINFASSPNGVYFSDPTKIVFSGSVYGGNTTNRWTAPRSMDGVTSFLIGGGLTQVSYYGAQFADDAAFLGNVVVVGGTQAYGPLSVSNGTVASINVSGIGIYVYPDFPTIAIDAPASGVQATAIVTGMVWDGVGTIAAAGSGYVKGNKLTVAGGTSATAAQLTVTEVDGSGAVTAFAGSRGGLYSVYPTNPAGVTGGGGTGFTINLTLWSVQKGSTTTQITAAGSGYASQPGVTFSAPVAGTPAARGAALMGTAAVLNALGITSSAIQASTSYANDGAAAAGGVAVGQFYRNGSVVQCRIT